LSPKEAFYFALGPIGAALLSVFILPLLTWYFNVEDIGRLAMLTTATSFCVLFFSLGLDQAYVREYHEVKDKSALFLSVIFPGLYFLVFTIVIFIIFGIDIAGLLFGISSTFVFSLLLISILCVFLSRYLGLILRMQERALAYSMSQLLPKIFLLALIGFYILFSVEATFQYLLMANVFASVAVLIVMLWNVKIDLLKSVFSKIDFVILKRMIGYGIPLIFSGLAYWGVTAVDRFLLRELSTFEELGIYSLAINFAAIGLVFQNIFTTVWVPIVYKWAANGVDAGKLDQVKDIVLLVIVMVFCLSAMLSWVISFFLPPVYDQVQYILIPCLACPLFYTLSEVTGIGIGIKRKTWFSLWATLITLAVNTGANLILIPIYGATGAAIASAIAFFVFLLVRTESSIYLGQTFSRANVYAFSLVSLVGCVFHVLYARELFIYLYFFWLAFFVFTLFYFRNVIIKLIIALKVYRDAN